MKAGVTHVQCTTLIWLGLLLASAGARLAAQDLSTSETPTLEFGHRGNPLLSGLADADTIGAQPASSGNSR